MATRDWSPTLILRSTVKPTLALAPDSATSVTLPTVMPETFTSLPGLIPPASLKYASYFLPCGKNGRLV